MFVLCPHCQFLVGLEPGSASPPERCPRCQQLLQPAAESAVADGAKKIPPPAPAIEPAPSAIPDAAVIEQPSDASTEATGDDKTAADHERTAAADAALMTGEPPTALESGEPDDSALAPSLPAGDDAAPVVVAATPAAPRARSRAWRPSAGAKRWMLLASIPLLLVLLALQSLLSDRARLAADAHWRPLITAVCVALRCQLPPWREPEAFTMLDRDVRPDPARPGVLHVTARFRNDARWPQPFPSVLLTLSDADGRIAGERLFTPGDYLGAAPHQSQGLASGQSVRIVLDVVEPPQGVVAFTFDLR
jgi:hypothetical protein